MSLRSRGGWCLGLLAACALLRADPLPPTVTGELKVLHFTSTTFGDPQTLRVWLPPGYGDDTRTYSVLYMMDGQNLFDRRTSSFGMEWEIDETLMRLIPAGSVEPIIVVGIDAPGSRRAEEYNPYPDPKHPTQGPPPGRRFPEFLVNEVMPLVAKHFHVKTGPSHTAIGGSSYGSVAALYALMTRPDVFGLGLLESTSLQVGDGGVIRDAAAITRPPLRLYVGVGDDEAGTPGIRGPGETDAQVQAKDDAFVAQQRDLVKALKALTPTPPKVKFTVYPGGHHQEIYWAERFPGAVQFLFPPRPR